MKKWLTCMSWRYNEMNMMFLHAQTDDNSEGVTNQVDSLKKMASSLCHMI